MNIVLIATQISFLSRAQTHLFNVKHLDDFIISLLCSVKSESLMNLTVLTDIDTIENKVERIGNAELRFINVLCCDSVVPEWLRPNSTGRDVCWGDNYLLLYAKPFVNGPFLVIKDTALLTTDFLCAMRTKMLELSDINRTYYFLSEQYYQNFIPKKYVNLVRKSNTPEAGSLIDSSGSDTTAVENVCENSSCGDYKCGGCVYSDVWVLTPDFFELSELQFESFLIENRVNRTMKFSIENVLGDLTLKEIVKLKPLFIK